MLSLIKQTVPWAVLALVGSPYAQAGDKFPVQADFVLSCQNPVKKGDTAQSLMKRYQGNAMLQETEGAEGSRQKILVLYPHNMDLPYRAEVFFNDDAMTSLASVRINIEKSQWTYQGLKILDPIQAVEKQNGKPLTLFGFGWDYGGHVTSFNGGAFSKPSGDCAPHFRFQIRSGKSLPKTISGEQKIKSSLPELFQAQAYLSEISLDFVDSK
ncbi:hypothetical protein [Undibacterium sp. TS12]|uniref:hypothetical protein n=1 Tax=Undibacterium sp. TS12 TaxID=2908202 RepID=UPI001F4CEC06|nr:hypothetical protein [Undibacterium sp. TS12]MCH8620541.1 hypothetical protein [Undibacterium sp. TS12]